MSDFCSRPILEVVRNRNFNFRLGFVQSVPEKGNNRPDYIGRSECRSLLTVLDLLQNSTVPEVWTAEIFLNAVDVLTAFEPHLIARRKREPLKYCYVYLIDIPANHEPGISFLVRSERFHRSTMISL